MKGFMSICIYDSQRQFQRLNSYNYAFVMQSLQLVKNAIQSEKKADNKRANRKSEIHR